MNPKNKVRVAPLGYRNVEQGGKRVIEPDPKLAPLVGLIFEEYATGRHSLKEVAQLARSEGFVYRKSGAPVPKSTIHTILRNRIYTGDFEWGGRRYEGTHEPLVSKELWDGVQRVMDGRGRSKHRKVKHDFAFARLLSCGHCGCSVVGEIKKQKYIYYHCTGHRQKCPEPYVREEVMEERFAELLGQLRFDDDVLEWTRQALRESHQDEKRHHD